MGDRVVINPLLTWGAESGALSYVVQMSAISSFATTIVNPTGIIATEYEDNVLSNNATYFWRVNAANAGSTSD
jgi:hypothetical protein